MPTIALWLATAITLVGVDEPDAGRAEIGTRITDFALTDDRGEVHPLDEWRGSRALVVVFLRAECPVAELYATPLAEMAHRFE
ncbi:redoxin domain-containing protein, partial [Singulisphaera rosea]